MSRHPSRTAFVCLTKICLNCGIIASDIYPAMILLNIAIMAAAIIPYLGSNKKFKLTHTIQPNISRMITHFCRSSMMIMFPAALDNATKAALKESICSTIAA